MTYATPDDVATELGRPPLDPDSDAAEIAQVQQWLNRTEAIIRLRIPDLDDRVDAGTLPEELVVSVEASVVARKVLNPAGVTSQARTRTLDDWSETQSETSGSQYMDGTLRLTDDEWALLGLASGEAFTITPYGQIGSPYGYYGAGCYAPRVPGSPYCW